MSTKNIIEMDYSKISNVKVEGINYNDYPDFVDAFIASADYNGEPMDDEQLDMINMDADYVYDCIMNYIY
jgi:hypothetical protein